MEEENLGLSSQPSSQRFGLSGMICSIRKLQEQIALYPDDKIDYIGMIKSQTELATPVSIASLKPAFT